MYGFSNYAAGQLENLLFIKSNSKSNNSQQTKFSNQLYNNRKQSKMDKLFKLSSNKFKSINNLLIFIIIYLLINLTNAQFFGPPPRQPLSNNLVSNSFDSPNEINSIELFVHENARAHHTSDYEIIDGINPPLVIRRADVFVIGIKFRKPYDPRRDKVRLEFMFGKLIFLLKFSKFNEL